MGQRTAGDRIFEAYLREHKVPVPEHEPDLGVGRRPDYLVALDGHKCLCEVKEFAPTTNSIPGSGSWPMETVLKPIRSKVHEGARQLRPAADLGHPLVVVLTNPHHAPVILGEQEVLWALEGDPVVRMHVGSTATGPPIHTVGQNGELRHDHPYLTAVVVLYRSLGEPEHYAAVVYVPNSGEAVALPDVFFRGPRDRVLEYSFDLRAYTAVHDPVAV
jgi:hypothetical protein